MPDPRGVDQSVLQQDLQRFSGVFIDRVYQAGEQINSTEGPPRTEVLRRVLLYQASVLDIASAPYPEVNLLDMLAFVLLARQTLEDYWVPEVFGDDGQPLIAAFDHSIRELWQIADKILTAAEQEQVRSVVEAWLQDNPGQYRVEAVRLFHFSDVAASAASERAKRTRGLLSSVKTATQSADDALLLAERAMFLAQRLPFVLRQQVRVGAQELFGDGQHELRAMIEKRAAVTAELNELVRRWIGYAVLAATVLIVIFWTGYVVARQLT